jgi:phosphoribosylamine---glycine ligase
MPDLIGEGSITVVTGSATEFEADLYVIGPEVPLVDGLADRLRAQGRLVVGPGADGARLEGSKAFMKELLAEAGVPTASFATFDDVDAARAHLERSVPPYVIKTDGLAAGKGVLVTMDLDAARRDVAEKLSGTSFGAAGTKVVIEEGLVGPECSLMALSDGTRAFACAPAQDFKRLADGDAGPNTGGMGAYSPMPTVDEALVDELMDVAVEPTLEALRARGIEYRGVLYAGLMLTPTGPKVIEFNVRFGDPETQAVIPRIDGDLFELFRDVAAGELHAGPRFTHDEAVTVVLAAPGYPNSPQVGGIIKGLGSNGQLAEPIEGVTVFHAGTTRAGRDGSFTVSGGRVLSVTGVAATLAEARAKAYAGAAQIDFEGMQLRTDIARTAAQEERS